MVYWPKPAKHGLQIRTSLFLGIETLLPRITTSYAKRLTSRKEKDTATYNLTLTPAQGQTSRKQDEEATTPRTDPGQVLQQCSKKPSQQFIRWVG